MIMLLPRFRQSLVLLAAPLMLSGLARANTGKKFCACLPAAFTFTFDFSLGCNDDISPDDPGIASFSCKVTNEGNEDPSDPIPTVVTGVQIIEIGQPPSSAVISTTTLTNQSFVNGSTFEYRSTADNSFPITTDAPKVLQMLITGINAAGEALLNLWVIEFTNQCRVFPVLTEGMTAGWTVMTSLTNPITEVCPASPGPVTTPAPVAPPPTAPTAPVAPPPTAPTAPVAPPPTAPVTPPPTAPTAPVVPPPTVTASPTAPGTAAPTATGTPAPTAPGTAAPTAAGTPAPTAPGTAAPTNAPTAVPTTVGTSDAPSDSPSAGPSVALPPVTSAPVPATTCDVAEAEFQACANANFAEGQQTQCEQCVSTALISQSGTTCNVTAICGALDTCNCEPCVDPLRDYTECLLVITGVTCDLSGCAGSSTTTPTLAPTIPGSDFPTATPQPTFEPTITLSPTVTWFPTETPGSDAPSDVPSAIPSSSPAPTPVGGGGVAPTAPTAPANDCTAITAAYQACSNANNWGDGTGLECENCVAGRFPSTGSQGGCEAFQEPICSGIFTECTACAACTTELLPYVECLFLEFGLACEFDCSGG